MSKTRVALCGLGLMGRGMAGRLLAAGFPVSLFNRDRAKAEAFAAAGARAADTSREAAEGADVVIAMVADDHASRAVWLGGDGALASVREGAVLIESSTLTVAWVKELAAAAAARGCAFLDAPVTGSRVHAAAGELNFLVGGDAATLNKVRPVLEAMSRSILHVGPTGSGALIKLINNAVCGVQLAALAEALALMERSGLDVARALPVLTNGTPGSPLVKAVSERMVSRSYDPHFLVRLMAKDLGYALAEGGQRALSLTTVAAALKVLQNGIAAGDGEKDIAAVVEQFRSD